MSNLLVEEWRAWAKADTSPDALVIQAAIDAAEEAANEYCGREFVIAEAVTTSARLYAPRGDDILRIDDAVEVVSITVAGSLIAATEYQLEPVNGRTSSGQLVPYDQARLLGSCWSTDYGKAHASVVARWGWTTLPARYFEAVRELTKDIVDMAEIRNGVITFTDFGALRVRENAHVASLLSKLRRVESYGFA